MDNKLTIKLRMHIRHEILNFGAPWIRPEEATKMAQAAVDVLIQKDDLVDVLAAGTYIARRDAEALRLLAQ